VTVRSSASISIRPGSAGYRFRLQVSRTTPANWIAGARVRRAQALLETTQLAVEQVAAESGSGSAAVMRQRFAEIVGTTPLDYRRAFSHGGRNATPGAYSSESFSFGASLGRLDARAVVAFPQ